MRKKVVDAVASEFTKARDIAGMTQKQLSEITGIHQADISKIECGLANPSLSTLKRLADGGGFELNVSLSERQE